MVAAFSILDKAARSSHQLYEERRLPWLLVMLVLVEVLEVVGGVLVEYVGTIHTVGRFQ